MQRHTNFKYFVWELRDTGRGGKKGQFLRDVIYGRPLTYRPFVSRTFLFFLEVAKLVEHRVTQKVTQNVLNY